MKGRQELPPEPVQLELVEALAHCIGLGERFFDEAVRELRTALEVARAHGATYLERRASEALRRVGSASPG